MNPSGLTTITKRIFSSTVALTILALLLVDFGIRHFRPLRFFNHTGLTTIKQNFLVSKLPQQLAAGTNPDVLLLGSSLVLVPAVRCDDQFHGRKTRYDRWYYRNCIDEYTKADFLQSLLGKKTGKKVEVLDLAVAASLMSDQYLILKKYLATGKHPKLIICAIAPRDFLDNLRPDLEKTPTYSILADLTCLQDLIQSKPTLASLSDFVFGNFSNYYKNRTDYNSFIKAATSRFTGHPIDLYHSTVGKKTARPIASSRSDVSVLDSSKADYGPKANVLEDLEGYRKIYLPVNHQLYDKQISYLEKFLQLADSNKIPVLLVDMPLTRENLEVLPLAAQKKYRADISRLAKNSGARLLIPEDHKEYQLADFEDSVHMNASGGKKLFTSIARALTDDRVFLNSWSTEKRQIGSLPVFWPFN